MPHPRIRYGFDLRVVEVERGSGVSRRPEDSDPLLLEGLLGGEREPVRGVVYVLGEHYRGDRGDLTVVDDHLFEVGAVGVPGGLYLLHGQLRLGYAVLVYVERSADNHLLGPELLELRYHVPVLFGLRIGPTVEQFLRFVGPFFVDRVRPDALPEDQALDYGRGVFHLEGQVVVVLGLHGREIIPRELLLQAEYVEGGDNVLRGELRAVAPLRALAQRYLEHVGRFVSPLRSHVRHVFPLGPPVHSHWHLQYVLIERQLEEGVGDESVVVPDGR